MDDGAARLDLSFRQGDTLTESFGFGDATGGPYDLTGCTIRMQIRREIGGDLLLDCTAYWTVSDPESGVATLEIPATASATLPAGDDACEGRPAAYVYDIEVEDGAARVQTWVAGRCFVTPQVTQ